MPLEGKMPLIHQPPILFTVHTYTVEGTVLFQEICGRFLLLFNQTQQDMESRWSPTVLPFSASVYVRSNTFPFPIFNNSSKGLNPLMKCTGHYDSGHLIHIVGMCNMQYGTVYSSLEGCVERRTCNIRSNMNVSQAILQYTLANLLHDLMLVFNTHLYTAFFLHV